MKSYVKGRDERAEISAVAAQKIAVIMQRYHIMERSSWGLDANSDGGMHDMHYSNKEQAWAEEDFLVDGDEVVGYCYKGKRVEFDGKIEVTLHSWDYSVGGGAQDEIDEGSVCIEKRK